MKSFTSLAWLPPSGTSIRQWHSCKLSLVWTKFHILHSVFLPSPDRSIVGPPYLRVAEFTDRAQERTGLTILCYFIQYKGLEPLWILVWGGVLEPIFPRFLRTIVYATCAPKSPAHLFVLQMPMLPSIVTSVISKTTAHVH